MNIKLIPQWRKAPKMISVQCTAMIVTLQSAALGIATYLPDWLTAVVPLIGGTVDSHIKGISVLLGLGAIVGRVIDQGLSVFDAPNTEPGVRVVDDLNAPTQFMERK